MWVVVPLRSADSPYQPDSWRGPTARGMHALYTGEHEVTDTNPIFSNMALLNKITARAHDETESKETSQTTINIKSTWLWQHTCQVMTLVVGTKTVRLTVTKNIHFYYQVFTIILVLSWPAYLMGCWCTVAEYIIAMVFGTKVARENRWGSKTTHRKDDLLLRELKMLTIDVSFL